MYVKNVIIYRVCRTINWGLTKGVTHGVYLRRTLISYTVEKAKTSAIHRSENIQFRFVNLKNKLQKKLAQFLEHFIFGWSTKIEFLELKKLFLRTVAYYNIS